MNGMTRNAKRLTQLIVEEYRIQDDRARKGFIRREQVLPCLCERLNRLSVKDGDLRQFLNDPGYIPRQEDERMDLPWATDPQEQLA